MGRKNKKEWDLADLLSVVGFVFELLKVVVNALRKRGGTIEHLRRLIKEPELVDKIFDLIVTKPMEMVKNVLLSLVGTTSTIITGCRFVVKNHFKVDASESAEMRISYPGDNFKNWFLNLVESDAQTMSLSYHTLLKNSVDGPIIQELGGEARVVTTAAVLWELLKAQRNGEAGALLTNGNVNIFYIKDASAVPRAVDVSWCGDGWGVGAFSVSGPDGWHAGDRVFSRNS